MFSKKAVYVGNLKLGGNAPVRVQTMLWRPLPDLDGNIRDLDMAIRYGAELIRVAFPDTSDFKYLKKLVEISKVPIVADIHYDPKLALLALEAGVSKLRWNPGTISRERIKDVIHQLVERKVPLRLGYNFGSIPTDRIRTGEHLEDAIIRIAMEDVQMLRDMGLEDIVISIKSSSPLETIRVNEKLARVFDGPIHIGVTEAGPLLQGTIYSASALGHLLLEGIGDTIRVSLSAEPWQEVQVAYEILCAVLGRCRGVRVISCPRCARSTGPVWEVAEEVKRRFGHISVPLTVAVMGCSVNGPGEASHADIGVAFGGPGMAVVFAGGRIVETFKYSTVEDIIEKISQYVAQIEEARKI